MREDLLDALRNAERDAACRVIVITGAGRAFCAGGDVDSMSSLQRHGRPRGVSQLLDAGCNVVLQIASMEKPVIASINGIAAVRMQLALACDYASRRTPRSSARRSSRSDCIPTGGAPGSCRASRPQPARQSC